MPTHRNVADHDLGHGEEAVPYFQPIYDLSTGTVAGYETLARMRTARGMVGPDAFLGSMDADGLHGLFTAITRGALAFLRELGEGNDAYVTVNVEPSTMLREGFVEGVASILAESGCRPDRLVLEMLEGGPIQDMEATTLVLGRLKALGIRLALDDVGSAYSSLARLKDLPFDILKLDRDFARNLTKRPEDLQFVNSILGLARGLDRILVVEGVETAEIMEALSALGVSHGQGYALGHPLPGASACLVSRIVPYGRVPTTLLGAYAAHLVIVEACRNVARQHLTFRWTEETRDPHACCIGKFLDKEGLHGTAYGMAHKRFHRKLTCDRPDWQAAAEDLRRGLLEALAIEADTRVGTAPATNPTAIATGRVAA